MLKVLFILFISVSAWARPQSLKVGDIILQPLRCYLCSLIEQQENSTFSHMGVVVKVSQEEILVAEAWGVVRAVALDDFLKKGDLKRAHLAIRSKESGPFSLMSSLSPLLGADYDHDFLWNNLGRDGREALYCSELITKLLNPFLKRKIPTKAMDFSQNTEAWTRYFHGNVPQGLPGNSPGDFERSSLFYPIGIYQDQQWNWN